MKKQYSTQQIHLYLDGMMNSKESERFEQALKEDEALRNHVCEIRKLKNEIHNFYKKLPIPPYPQKKQTQKRPYLSSRNVLLGAAASIFIMIATPMLWLSISTSSSQHQTQVAQLKTEKFLLHIDSNDPIKQKMALEKAEHLVETSYQSGHPVQVEIVANYNGITLFDAKNLNKLKVLKTLSQYDNVRLLACKRALERMKEKGQTLHLIHSVEQDKPALDEIVDKMQKGWKYIKI